MEKELKMKSTIYNAWIWRYKDGTIAPDTLIRQIVRPEGSPVGNRHPGQWEPVKVNEKIGSKFLG